MTLNNGKTAVLGRREYCGADDLGGEGLSVDVGSRGWADDAFGGLGVYVGAV